MSSPRLRNSTAPFVFLAISACCNQATPFPNGLSSFAVQIQDMSGQTGNFPLSPVKIQVTATALDQDGNPLTGFNGNAFAYVTPGQVMQNAYLVAQSPDQEPVLSFQNGVAHGTIYAEHVFGDTAVWVEDREDAVDGGVGGYATGVSQPNLAYGYPLLSDLQITADDTTDPLENNYVVLDQTKTRCIVPPPAPYGSWPPDGGYDADAGCDPAYQYNMDLIVTAVQVDGFYAMDLNTYYLDGGVMVPKPGWDPNTGAYDLPGSWAYMFVYNYDTPQGLYIGSRLTTLSGQIGEFVGDTQMDFPAWTVNSNPQFADPHPQDVPPPVPVDPVWCTKGGPGDHLADQYICAPSTTNLYWESLESGLIVARDVTMPTRWLNCDISGTGKVPYRAAAGCLPTTAGEYCGEANAAIAHCPEGTDCVANECAQRCQTDSDCNSGPATAAADLEACVDGHCQNACLCREYCDSLLDCSEQSEYTNYGQYDGWIPGIPEDGGYGHPWKLSLLTRNGAPNLDPQANPGMVTDVEGMLIQVRASDPMWEIAPRIQTDVCCHEGSPGCDPAADGGTAPPVPICPQPTSQ